MAKKTKKETEKKEAPKAEAEKAEAEAEEKKPEPTAKVEKKQEKKPEKKGKFPPVDRTIPQKIDRRGYGESNRRITKKEKK